MREPIREIESRLAKYTDSMAMKWLANEEEVEQGARKKLQMEETDRWKQLISQGQGIHCFANDKIVNALLYNPKLLKLSRYLDTLRLQTNTFSTRIVLRRINERINPSCRKCSL